MLMATGFFTVIFEVAFMMSVFCLFLKIYDICLNMRFVASSLA